MAKTSTKKKIVKKAPAKKASVLDGIDTVKATSHSSAAKEAERKQTRIEDGSLEQDFVDFSALIASRGWLRLKFINEENARLLGQQILDKRDLEGTPLDEEACDRLRDQRDAILEVMNFPEKVIERYQEANAPVIDDESDPYETHEQAAAREDKEKDMENSP